MDLLTVSGLLIGFGAIFGGYIGEAHANASRGRVDARASAENAVRFTARR